MGAEPAPARMDVDEFLRWAEDRPGRYELDDGLVFAMSPERVRHAEVKGAVHQALRAACEMSGAPCRALPDGMTVKVDRQTAYEPDALVYCGPRLPGDAIEVPAPVIVVEVLSPSTAYRDVGRKLAGYFQIASVQHYLIVDPDRPVVVHHQRGEGDLIRTRIVTGGILRLDPPGLDLVVADLWPAE
ncbi:Uma2 family endonuclease [uncultured Enterovirga sp.]|uniref:Uma2 family endonuclease n=1 Tax=uncultured Enterovirga sp. TaxID=2026352 RepID=UPI0035CB133B